MGFEPIERMRFGRTALLAATVLLAGLFAVDHYLRKPIRAAKQIQPGDRVERVHELLGSPTAVFETDAELRRSALGPRSFAFTEPGSAGSDVPLAMLPVVTGRAEWFESTPTAGHLVYFEDDRVELVYRGGT